MRDHLTRALQSFAKWRWGPSLFMAVSAVAIWLRPNNHSCGGSPWWVYVIPFLTFFLLWALMIRSVGRRRS